MNPPTIPPVPPAENRACQATSAEELRWHITSPSVPKPEPEHWAAREIDRLQTQVQVLRFAAIQFCEGVSDVKELQTMKHVFDTMPIPQVERVKMVGLIDAIILTTP